MPGVETWNPKAAWRMYRLEAETVKHYPQSYALYMGRTHRDILLDQILPTLLYIKAASILDDSLNLWLSDNDHSLRKPYKNDFNGRLCYLSDMSLYQSVEKLHSVRQNRNKYAHEPGERCDWQTLERDLLAIEDCLVSLKLAEPTKELEYFAERSGLEPSQDPNVEFSQRFGYGVKEGQEIALHISWSEECRKE